MQHSAGFVRRGRRSEADAGKLIGLLKPKQHTDMEHRLYRPTFSQCCAIVLHATPPPPTPTPTPPTTTLPSPKQPQKHQELPTELLTTVRPIVVDSTYTSLAHLRLCLGAPCQHERRHRQHLRCGGNRRSVHLPRKTRTHKLRHYLRAARSTMDWCRVYVPQG